MTTKINLKDYIELVLPVWAVCAVMNDDYSGLTDEEEKEIDDLFESLRAEHNIKWGWVEVEGDSYFSPHNDLNRLGDDCYSVNYHFVPKEEK